VDHSMGGLLKATIYADQSNR